MKAITAITAIAMAVSTPALAAWEAKDTATTIDGRTGVAALLKGEAIGSDDKTFPAWFGVRCARKSTGLWVEPVRGAAQLQSRDWMKFSYHRETGVRFKVDGGAIERAVWSGSPNHDMFGLMSGSGIGLLKQLAAADKGQSMKLTIEAHGMTGYGSFVFDITGIKDAMAPIAKECGW